MKSYAIDNINLLWILAAQRKRENGQTGQQRPRGMFGDFVA